MSALCGFPYQVTSSVVSSNEAGPVFRLAGGPTSVTPAPEEKRDERPSEL